MQGRKYTLGKMSEWDPSMAQVRLAMEILKAGLPEILKAGSYNHIMLNFRSFLGEVAIDG